MTAGVLTRSRDVGKQGLSGAFPSEVTIGDRLYRDENAFMTSLVLLELIEVAEAEHPLSAKEIDRALDFLERCEAQMQPGAFCFYPKGDDVVRAPVPLLPPDADDTALVWTTLVRYGRRSRSDAKSGVEALQQGKIYSLRGDEPSWVRPGGFRTWLSGTGHRNPVDVCVNANIAAFLAYVGFGQSAECLAACELVERAVQITGGDSGFLRSLTPYYAHMAEFRLAVQRAVNHGAASLISSRERLRSVPTTHEDLDPDRPICCNAHGRPLWRSPLLQLIRALPRRPGAPISHQGVKQCF